MAVVAAQGEDKSSFYFENISPRICKVKKNVLIDLKKNLTSPARDTLSRARTPIRCCAPLPVAKVTEPARTALPTRKGKTLYFSLLFVLQSGIDLSVWRTLFSPCSSPFPLFRTCKEADRNKAGLFSEISKGSAPSPSPSPSFSQTMEL